MQDITEILDWVKFGIKNAAFQAMAERRSSRLKVRAGLLLLLWDYCYHQKHSEPAEMEAMEKHLSAEEMIDNKIILMQLQL